MLSLYFVCICVGLDQFVFLMSKLVMLGLLHQNQAKRLAHKNDIFYMEWDVKNLSVNLCVGGLVGDWSCSSAAVRRCDCHCLCQ